MKKTKILIGVITVALAGLILSGCFAKNMKAPKTVDSPNKQISIIAMDDYKIHTFYGVSNSHIIETPNKLIMVDAQFNFKLAKKLKAYIETLNKPLEKIILSHEHPDHWFGYPIFEGIDVVTLPSVIKSLKRMGPIYIKGSKPRMGDNIPDTVVPAKPSLKLGKQKWDGLCVVVEEYLSHESASSVVIKIPKYGIIIGQDLFYNGVHLVAGNRENNKNWAKILRNFNENEGKHYKTILTGHGKTATPAVFNEEVEYLEALEEILASGATGEAVKEQLLAKFPNRGGKAFTNLTVRNLFRKH